MFVVCNRRSSSSHLNAILPTAVLLRFIRRLDLLRDSRNFEGKREDGILHHVNSVPDLEEETPTQIVDHKNVPTNQIGPVDPPSH